VISVFYGHTEMMPMVDGSASFEFAVRRSFARRWRLARFLFLVLVCANLVRARGPLDHLVPPRWHWLSDSWLWFPLLLLPFMIWAARCPACGGSIRLDGRTCATCGRNLRAQAAGKVEAVEQRDAADEA
jgi:hypothetical protein